MRPRTPIANIPHAATGHSVFVADCLQGQSCHCPQSTNLHDVSLGKRCLMASAPSLPSAVYYIVSPVLFRQRPSQIVGPVVVMVSVLMRDLMFARWFRAVKYGANNDVDRHTTSGAEVGSVIFSSAPWMQHGASPEAISTEAVGYPTVHRPHTPKARRLVARVSRHWTPFLRLGYRGLSHIALLQRVVRDWRRGERLSSAPNSNNLSLSRQVGISILASRV